MKNLQTQHLMIRGRVQGVGFRYSMCDRAESLGVTGWVRNCADGSVEAMVHGSTDDVQAIIEWAKKGPLGAHVTAVDIDEGVGSFDTFTISHVNFGTGS